jgi:hypothetical protein
VATVELSSEPFPWRTATLVAAGIASVELIGLIVIGAFVLAHPFRHHAAATTPAATTPRVVVHHAAKPRHVVPIPAKDRFAPLPARSLRPRSSVRVLVLNANGVQGAAHVEAARLQSLGYVIGGAANAPSHRYARSMVMFVPGYVKEARRLARETHIRLVSPVDGLTPAALSGSRLVVLLGS